MTIVQPTAGIVKSDRMLDTSTARSLSLWHEVLTLQVDLFRKAEVAALRSSTAWQRSRTVLEAGCGNGRYLAAVARAFDDKRYVGIDSSEGLVAIANETHACERARFGVADFLKTVGSATFDAVVMRFVVQHLSDLGTILTQAASYLKPGGSLFIIEPDVANSANTPATPAFDAMLREYAVHAAERGALRGQLGALPGLIAAEAGWSVTADHAIAIENDGPFAGTDLFRLYQGWTGLCEHQAAFEFDFAAVRVELDRWAQLKSGHSRIGLRLIEARLEREWARPN
jgi:ubiquinone/menaquinone biosynthesis C-methylase UbiE